MLRGVAVLGIYMVNVQAFAMTNHGYANPTLEADFGAAGRAVWLFVDTFFRMKFIVIFTALFGAGLVLTLGPDAAGGTTEKTARHGRRMAWLLVIGLIHAYGFWYGDILVPYAIAGLIVAGARDWPLRRLVVTGVGLVLLTSVMFLAAQLSVAGLPPDAYAEAVAGQWAPPPEAIGARQELFRAPWHERFIPLAGLAVEYEVGQLVFYMPRFLGVMMLGMALLRSGFFHGRWPVTHLLAAAALAPLGALASWLGARMQMAADFELVAMAWPQALMMLVAAPQALGYAAVVMLACRPAALAIVRAPFAAAGRMALSVYLGCTLASWLIFYGPPGLGRIGALSRSEQAETVFLVWLVALIAAPAWLAVFRFGPLEWAWRSLTYRRLQPMRR